MYNILNIKCQPCTTLSLNCLFCAYFAPIVPFIQLYIKYYHQRRVLAEGIENPLRESIFFQSIELCTFNVFIYKCMNKIIIMYNSGFQSVRRGSQGRVGYN